MAVPMGASPYQQGVGGVTSYTPGPSDAHAALLGALVQHAATYGASPIHAALLHAIGTVHANPNPIIMSGIGYQHGTPGHPVVSDFPNPAYDPSRGLDDVYGPAKYDYAAYQNATNRDSGQGRMR